MNNEGKVKCPHCGSNNCFTEEVSVEGANPVASYMCMGCGYTSTTLNEKGSELIKEHESTSPQLMIDLKWVDPQTNLVWYPMALNFPNTGIVFPDGTSKKDWKWRAVPAVDIPKEDQKKYPIATQPGQYYTKKADMEQSVLFEQNEFNEACKFIGLIK